MFQAAPRINGSGVIVFIESNQQIYLFAVISKRKSGIFIEEQGGVLDKGKSPEQNAMKELFEESFAGLQALSLGQYVIVNQRYQLFPVLIRIEDKQFFQDVVEMNRKIIYANDGLRSFKENLTFELIPLEAILNKKVYKDQKGQTFEVHQRLFSGLNELQLQDILKKDGKVYLEPRKYRIDRMNYPNPQHSYHVFHKQLSYIIE